MSLMGIDIAWDRPSVAAIKATGAQFVARYFSQDPTKDLTAGEVVQYKAAGLGIVTVYESSAGRALQGIHAGGIDAGDAAHERASVGLPADHVIYFAVDTDTDWASVQPYFEGICNTIPKAQVGVYGGYKVVEGAHAWGLKYLWQTTAWSGGQWSPYATIKQVGGTVLSGAADVDYAMTPDYGQGSPTSGDDLPTPHDVWAFKAQGMDGIDMRQYVVDIWNATRDLESKVNALESIVAKLNTGGVDPAVVAKDVAHDLGQALGSL